MDAQISHSHTLHWITMTLMHLSDRYVRAILSFPSISNNDRIARYFKNTPAQASAIICCACRVVSSNLRARGGYYKVGGQIFILN